MAETRAQLLARKADLLAALRLAEQDLADGLLDEAAYHQTRRRYEAEAAEVLKRLDSLPPQEGTEAPRAAPEAAVRRTRRTRRAILGGSGALALAAIAFFLASALQPRAASGTATGGAGQTAVPPTPSPRLLAAQRAVRAHPRSLNALLTLGDEYLSAGQVAAADVIYRQAMALDPRAPQPATLHALIEGNSGHRSQALALVHRVERQSPNYSRAWLLDGILSSQTRAGLSHALVAWRRFLALDPHSSFTPQVRKWIAQAEKSRR